MSRRVGIVFLKEVVDNFRDRRALTAAFVFTLIGPAVTGGAILATAKIQADKLGKPITVPTGGAENAPALISYLQQHGVTIKKVKGALATELEKGKHDVAMAIPEGYGDDFRAARPATVQVIYDASRRSSMSSVKRLQRLLQAYGKVVGALRLLVRGVDPNISQPVAIENVDLSTPESLAAMLLGVLPFFIVMSVFMGGYYIVADSTVGELERGSLEPLFINPVARWEFLLGKFCAAATFSTIGLVVALVGFWLVPHVVSTEGLGITIRLDALVLAQIFLLVIPFVGLATSLGMIVSTLSKGFKEAQAMLSFLMLLSSAPGIVLSFAPFENRLWMMFVPILSEQILINELVRGDHVEGVFVAFSATTTACVTALGFLLAVRLYRGERVFAQR